MVCDKYAAETGTAPRHSVYLYNYIIIHPPVTCNVIFPEGFSKNPWKKILTKRGEVDIMYKLCENESLAQLAEHLTFNQGVRGSNPRWFTIKAKQYRCRRPETYGINCFRAFSARKFDDDSIDANHCFPLTGGIRTPFFRRLAYSEPCGALFEAVIFKKGAIFLSIEYTKFEASICWSRWAIELAPFFVFR